jgi:predicted anti-sigma-YlaC factor YlaD
LDLWKTRGDAISVFYDMNAGERVVMPADCTSAQEVVSFLLGKRPERSDVSEAEIESAFRHLKRCHACRGTLNANEQARFIHHAILERE